MPKHLTVNDESLFLQPAQVNQPNGVAGLDGTGHIPSALLPGGSTAPVTSVNGEIGNVVLTAADVSAVPAANVGAANGVAPLDGTSRLPVAKLPTTAVQSVNGYAGPSVTLTAADFGAISQITADGRYMRQDSIVYNAKEHGAVINGTTDDAPAINSLLSTSPAGSVVLLPPGDVAINSPIVVPPGKTLMGMRTNLMKVPGLYDPVARIKPLATFTGVAAVVFKDQATGGYSTVSGEQRLMNLMIYGAAGPAGLDGIQAKGNIQNVVMHDVTVREMSNNGIFTGSNAGAYPYSWRLHRVMVDNCLANGMSVQNMTDLTMIDCQAIGNSAHGFVLNNLANSQISTSRAEWNGNHGWYITGSWGSGTGSGGMQMSNIGTDRNGFHGVFIDATGTGPIVISGLMTRRDGRNGGTGGGGYAGLCASGSTMPLTIGPWVNSPGVDDNGTGTSSPQYGGSFTGNTFVQIDGAYLHANTAGLFNGGSNTTLQLGANVQYATGPTSAPVRTFGNQLVPKGSLVVNAADYAVDATGATDSTTGLQAAVTALGSRGGVILLPPGDYLLNGSSPLNLNVPVTLQGSGHGATSIRIGASFTGSSAITVNSDDCMITGMQIRGVSSTVTSNPACHGVTASGVQEFRMTSVTIQHVNGYGLRLLGSAGTTLHGTQIYGIKIQSCAGGMHIKSDSTATAANVQISNIFTRFLGVSSGANANLDGIRIEDSWDILGENVLAWMNATTGGTGAAFRVTGNCAAIFIHNLDALGPQTGVANAVIESGTNGDPQNVQISGGVIQQGLVGLLISGASNQVRVRNVRILNNQTHNVSVTSTGYGIFLDECLLSQGGQGATGTNYDVNWTGTADGYITDCRFGSSVVTAGTAGVQGIVNIAAGTVVRVILANFAGTGSSSSNWFPTSTPQITSRVDGTNYEMRGNTDMVFAAGQRLSLRPNAAGNNTLAINVLGTAVNDNFRLLGDGTQQYGTGALARDTTTGRAAAGVWYTDKNILVGSATALGDNGVGEIQLANAATVPTTNPTNGAVLYSQSGVQKVRHADGTVLSMGDVSTHGFSPLDHALITWTHPVDVCTTSFPLNTGVVYLGKVKIVGKSTLVSNISYGIVTAGTTMTSGQNFVGLYDSSGTRLALSADQTTNFGSQGLKTAALTAAQTLAVGTYYVAFLSVGTGTQPQVAASGGVSSIMNVGLTTATSRFLTSGSGLTALPTSITLSSGSLNTGARWAGLS